MFLPARPIIWIKRAAVKTGCSPCSTATCTSGMVMPRSSTVVAKSTSFCWRRYPAKTSSLSSLWEESAAQENAPEDKTPAELPRGLRPMDRVIFVLAMVGVLCGGNGLGIVAAGVYWKLTGNVGGAILIIVCVTTAAILAAVLIALFYQHYVKKHLK